MNNIDWTDSFNRKEISDSAENMLDETLREIHLKRLKIHTAYHLTVDEIGKLYRWPLYVGINTFVERLVRTLHDKQRGQITRYETESKNLNYGKDINVTIFQYFNDYMINCTLLNNISSILMDDSIDRRSLIIDSPKSSSNGNSRTEFKRQYTQASARRYIKRIISKFYILIVRVFTKSESVYEFSTSLNLVFPIKDRFIEKPYKQYPVDNTTRQIIRKCCSKVFQNKFSDYLKEIEHDKKIMLSDLYAEWIDHTMPTSLIEGLTESLEYYEKMLKGWDLKYVHLSSGYFYNDNMKCFSLLAKRKNALIISHDHGVNNFVKLLTNNSKVGNTYKGSSCYFFNDYYLYWGAVNRSPGDAWDDVERVYNIKIIRTGSVYLSTLKKWKKSKINPKKITLLFTSGPLRSFMASLQEITPEKNFAHRKKVLEMLEKLLQDHSNLKILYKTFMGIDLSNDPITEILSEYFDQGRIELTSVSPIEVMPEVDIAFFDMISTGFAEAIQIGVPTLVYSNDFDYKVASDEGKIINDELEDCGMVFYDKESGLRSFEKIVNDSPSFQKASMKPIRQYQEAIAFPVSKKEFLKSIDKKIE